MQVPSSRRRTVVLVVVLVVAADARPLLAEVAMLREAWPRLVVAAAVRRGSGSGLGLVEPARSLPAEEALAAVPPYWSVAEEAVAEVLPGSAAEEAVAEPPSLPVKMAAAARSSEAAEVAVQAERQSPASWRVRVAVVVLVRCATEAVAARRASPRKELMMAVVNPRAAVEVGGQGT
jgi:hypothetical protein